MFHLYMPDSGACSERMVNSTSSDPTHPVMATHASGSERRWPIYLQSLESGISGSSVGKKIPPSLESGISGSSVGKKFHHLWIQESLDPLVEKKFHLLGAFE